MRLRVGAIDRCWPLHNGPCASGCADFVDPVASWTNALDTWPALDDPDVEPTQRRSPWVGIEYLGGELDRYKGRFEGRVLYGDWCGGWVRAIEVDAFADVVYDEHAGHLAGATSFRQGPDGYVYATAYGSCFTAPYKPSKLIRAILDEYARAASLAGGRSHGVGGRWVRLRSASPR